MSAPKRTTCAGCGRKPAACWAMPCLELEQALSKGARAVNRWCRQSGAPFRVTHKRGRPRKARCAKCGALPCHQQQARALATPESPTRYWVATIAIEGGIARDFYSHSHSNARAARAAIQRDPTLVRCMTFDGFVDRDPSDHCVLSKE